jgi:amino acid adenylation domain-containing protein/non-ribosomal peptide synthase protein (TIGR01720 family)
VSGLSDAVRRELTRFLLEQVKEQRLEKGLAVSFLNELRDRPGAGDVAVVGLACRFPLADSKEEFWANLVAGRHAIRPFPPDRRADLAGIDDGRTELFEGGFLDRVDLFDHDYFRIPPNVARHLDPYQRLFLETLVEAIEDAGYHRGALHGKPVGVFAGNDHTHRLFNSYLDYIEKPDFNSVTGSWTGVLASRLSYLLNLRGPAVVVDTSCSSGLVALDYAMKALRHGDCEVALVGAANLFFAPGKGIVGEVENETAEVRAFDRRASGTVWGEGVAAVMVKPLAHALRDGDHVYGVIKGIAVNNDGASNGLTAPNARAQQEVVLKAWERAAIDPDELSYIETHGTGTNLGDPIEIKGLVGAFSRHTARKQFCGIGSVKTNIGHTVGVAGLASLIKVLIGLERHVLPPSLNFDAPNPLIDFCNSPVYVNDRVRDWARGGRPRLAGVSSFSLSGTNCHAVLQEAPERPRPEGSERPGPRLFPISARTPELLAVTIRRYLAFFGAGAPVHLADACFTAAVGREHHPERAAVVAEGVPELGAGLTALLAAIEGGGEPVRDGRAFYAGAAPHAERPAAAALEGEARSALHAAARGEPGALASLAALYTAGAAVAWDELYRDEARRRVPLPPQPFQRSRFWDRAPREVGAGPAAKGAPRSLPALTLPDLLAAVEREAPRVAGLDGVADPLPYATAAYIWTEVLGYPRLELTDDFYALGGDSITGARVVHLFNALFGLGLGLGALLGAPTLGAFVGELLRAHDFARLVRGGTGEPGAGGRAGTIEALPPAPHYELSRAQKRMFLLDRLSPGSTVYNVNALVRLEETPDLRETEAILRRLIERHEILRTGFELRDGEPVQVVHDSVPFAVERLEIADATAPEQTDEALRQVARRFVRPFDLSRPPLLRVGFVRTPSYAWYMLVDMHHIVTDGSSMGVLVDDFLGLKRLGRLDPLPFQYKDFAAWQNGLFGSDAYARHAEYWARRFEGGIPVLDLATDYPRPAVQDFRGARERFTIDAELARSVSALARAQGATLFMVLLAGFKVLLYRLGAGDDLVVGSPVAGRGRLDLDGLIGMFVNTLPLRDRIEPGDTFASFLATVKANTLSALDHQDFPYESLLDVLQVTRSAGRNPLFDLYFVLQNEDMGLGDERGVRPVPFDSGTAKFDMTVVARATAEGIEVDWEYAVSLYTASTIRRMAAQLVEILRTVTEDPEVAVRDIDLLTARDRELILETYNDTATPFPGARGIPALFEDVVRRRPSAVAVETDGAGVTYEELNARANRLAHLLLRQGVRRGECVALLFDRSVEMIVAILAVLKAGGAYMPIDLDNPPERTRAILTDSRARLLLAGAGVPVPAGADARVIRPEALDLADLPADDPSAGTNGEDLAYVMFTSGSTGRPKGTLIRHASVIRVVRDTDYISLTPADALLQLSNYAFDGSVFDIFGALLNGGRLVLLRKQEVVDMDALAGIIRGRGVTVFFVTTALFNVLVDTRPECLAGVRHVLFGGEAASTKHVAKAFRLLGEGRLIHVYGPTETTVFATALAIDRLDEALGAVPIGRPIANTRVYVLDDAMRPVPHGVPGELLIGGEGLALGYLNRDELTAERFVPDPFRPGERVYRSGDLVKWLDDGSILFLGRRDHQVKIRGFRIELGEIEAAIARHPDTRECLVVAEPDASGRKELCAYVVPVDPARFDAGELRGFLSGSLPDYMVPHAIVGLPAFPLNANGKVDRRALPSPSPVSASGVAPRDDREAALASVWASLLDLPAVGIHDNFFALGGDSIKGIQVVARLRARGFAVEMPLLFQHQTIAELAPHLVATGDTGAEQGAVTGVLPLGPIQSWFLSSHADEPQHFNQSMYVELPHLPATEEVRVAAQALCAHHDALRAVFRRTGEGWDAFVRDASATAFHLVEWHGDAWEPGTPETDLRLGMVQASLRLEGGPLMAIGVLRGEGRGGLCVAVHHLVVDVVSWQILLEDLQTCLAAAAAGEAPVLPPKTASVVAWNEALHRYARTAAARSLPYWRRLAETSYAEICPASLPHGRLADAGTDAILLDARTSGLVMGEGNRAYGTEPQHLLLAALGRALEAWQGPGRYLVRLEGHGRDGLPGGPEVSRTVGWFTSAFPFALPESGGPGDAIRRTKDALRTVPAKGLDYGVLAYLTPDLAAPDRAALRSLAPQVGFNFLGSVDTGADRDGVTVRPLGRELTTSPVARLELAVDIVAAYRDGQIEVEALFDATRLSRADVRRLLEIVREELGRLVAHCMAQEVVERTASDFTAGPLAQEELDAIFADLALQ